MIVRECASRPSDAVEECVHALGSWCERLAVFGKIVVVGDLADLVRSRAHDKTLQRKTAHAVNDDVRPAIRERVRIVYLSHAPDPTDLELRLRNIFGAVDDPEPGIARDAIAQHLAIPRLEDVQRKRRAGEQYQRQRK